MCDGVAEAVCDGVADGVDEAAEPMVMEYRKERGADFWDDFEILYKRAKEIGIQHNT